jgi:hypothetical protein
MNVTSRSYPAAQPHGPIEEIIPDVFVVYGTMRMAPLMRISRNMVICREGDELTLLNPIRLSAAGEIELEKLGRVTNVVRLGCFHGMDDLYCVDRFDARFWCQPDSKHYPEPVPDVELRDDTELPIRDARVITFRATRVPECVVLIEREGGLLVTCDSLQHYANWQRTSFVARLVMRYYRFSKSTLIGPIWLKYMTSAGGDLREDFDRLLALEFERLISAHGALVDHGAHAAVEQAVTRAAIKDKSR